MAKLLYTAKNTDGTSKAGFIDAATAAEAVAKLKKEGFQNIQLHNNPMVTSLRPDRQNLDAELELQLRHNPGPKTVLRVMGQHNRVAIITLASILACILAFGLLKNDLWVLLVGLVGGVTMFTVWSGELHHSMRYNQLVSAMALGRWAKARELIATLRQGANSDLVGFDVDVREAQLDAREGRLAKALVKLKLWHAILEKTSPAMFDARVASVYLSAHDYANYIACMRRSWEISGHDPSCSLDIALAEAQFGDFSTATVVMAEVDSTLIPAPCQPFVAWTHGMIALRQNDQSALTYLAEATRGFLEMAAHPASWTALIVCTGYYVLALAQHNRQSEAEKMMTNVALTLAQHNRQFDAKEEVPNIWSLLKLYVDPTIFAVLQQHFPGKDVIVEAPSVVLSVCEIKRVFRGEVFTFDSDRRVVLKNNNRILYFDDISMLQLRTIYESEGADNHRLFLVKKDGTKVGIGQSIDYYEILDVAGDIAVMLDVEIVREE